MEEYSALNVINDIIKKGIREVEIPNEYLSMTVENYEESYIHDNKIDISINCASKKVKMDSLIDKVVEVKMKPCDINVNKNFMKCTVCSKAYGKKKKDSAIHQYAVKIMRRK